MAGGSETSLRPAGGPECGFPRPQKPTTPSKKEQGAPRAGRGRSGTPKNQLSIQERARGPGGGPPSGPTSRTTRPETPRHEEPPRTRYEPSRPQEPNGHGRNTTTNKSPRHTTSRPRGPEGGPPPGPDHHKPAYRQKRACPNAPAPPRRPDPTKPADRTKESAREPSFGAPRWAQRGF